LVEEFQPLILLLLERLDWLQSDVLQVGLSGFLLLGAFFASSQLGLLQLFLYPFGGFLLFLGPLVLILVKEASLVRKHLTLIAQVSFSAVAPSRFLLFNQSQVIECCILVLSLAVFFLNDEEAVD